MLKQWLPLRTDPLARWALCASLVGVGTVACTSSHQSLLRISNSTAGPTIVFRDSVILDQPDSLSLGMPAGLAVAANGDIFVGDAYNMRVVRYDPTGRVRHVYGRRGRGPGDFSGLGRVFLIEDTILAVSDPALRRLQLFRRDDGKFLRMIPHPESPFLGRPVAESPPGVIRFSFDGMSMAYPAEGGMKTGVIARWNWRTDTTFGFLGGYPAAHRRDPNFGTSYSGVAAETRGEDWLVYYNGESAVYVLDSGGRMVSRHGLPEARRRGVPAKLAERFNEMDPTTQYNAASWITGFGRLRPGLLAIVHLDEDFVGRRMQMAFDNYRIFFSLARDDLSTACVDAPFDRPLDSRPVVTILGNRVLVLSQHLTSDRDAAAIVYSLDLTDAGCHWIEMPKLPIE